MRQLEFNLKASVEAKEAGIRRATDSLPGWNLSILEDARRVAREIARKNGQVSADDVVADFSSNGIDISAKLGNAMGGLFKGKEWQWTGRYIKSTRVHAHANLLRVWKLK